VTVGSGSSVPRRLARGYTLLFTGLLRGTGTLIVLLMVSAAVTLPLWYAAHHLPGVFNVAVIAGILAGLIVLVRRILSGTVWFRISLFVLIGIAVGTAVAGFPLVGGITVVATTGLIAWRVVPN